MDSPPMDITFQTAHSTQCLSHERNDRARIFDTRNVRRAVKARADCSIPKAPPQQKPFSSF